MRDSVAAHSVAAAYAVIGSFQDDLYAGTYGWIGPASLDKPAVTTRARPMCKAAIFSSLAL